MRISLVALCVGIVAFPSDRGIVDHKARITLDPASGSLDVVDTLSVGLEETSVYLALNRSLHVHPVPGVIIVDPDTSAAIDIPGEVARIVRLEASHGLPDPLIVRYTGRLHHAFEGKGDYARGFETTVGIIDSAGVFLSGASYWLPTIPDRMMTFTLHVSLPPGWECVSQGIDSRSPGFTTWHCSHPMEEAYLVAGRFTRDEQACGGVSAQAYLLSPDSALAQTYLDATCRYLALYDSMIGSYAYQKFALVENFWQTGYGMPSFTLLGSMVIRLPFIVHTSYGHEILHNWFGNGIYVDYESGNWCEGLTAYLADHYYKELAGEDREYRLRQLQHYSWYTAGKADMPLTEFRERHSSATAAVGYGKAAMVFHMLRRQLGDEAFFRGVREFYATHLFRRATWDDVAVTFSDVAGEDLQPFFAQWVTRVGAPELILDAADPVPGGVRVVLSQSEPAYIMRIPVAVTIAAGDSHQVRDFRLTMTGTRLDTVLPVQAAQQVVIDPAMDIFRILQPGEGPPGIGRILGADTLQLLSSPLDSMIAACWPTEGSVQIVDSFDPEARSLMVAGDSPAIRALLAPFFGDLIEFAGDTLAIDADCVTPDQTLIAVGETEDAAMSWIRPAAGIDEATLAAVLTKVVHYGSSSLLTFGGTRTMLKKTWPVRDNPMMIRVSAAE
ncbi:M1 family peptidase [Candidatus Fermentibacteria bacterium]|nr:M1 family peptidase [Candidatus Fermentibacteria bacterium]